MEGRAVAPAAGTVLNALATGIGSAFAIDAYTTATVNLDTSGSVSGTITENPDADTRLIERCVERVIEAADPPPSVDGGHVTTESDIPIASGLKSSSAAANATVLATLDALDMDMDREDACRIGVEAARDVSVTVTGAFDDASASMLGGLTVTDNTNDSLLHRDKPDWNVLVYTPDIQSYSAEADVERCQQIGPIADIVFNLIGEEKYKQAMTVNGIGYCMALEYSPEPIFEALPDAAASLSGTGPSFVAVGDPTALESVKSAWNRRDGHSWQTTTQTRGAQII